VSTDDGTITMRRPKRGFVHAAHKQTIQPRSVAVVQTKVSKLLAAKDNEIMTYTPDLLYAKTKIAAQNSLIRIPDDEESQLLLVNNNHYKVELEPGQVIAYAEEVLKQNIFETNLDEIPTLTTDELVDQ